MIESNKIFAKFLGSHFDFILREFSEDFQSCT